MTETASKLDYYNYESFRKDRSVTFSPAFRSEFMDRLNVGSEAPDFTAKDLDGRQVKLSDFRGKENVVLEFGSITCPCFIEKGCDPKKLTIEKLYHQFKDRGFEFFMIYVREAHPGEKISAHRSYQEKVERAKQLKREENTSIPIIVDTVDGEIHKLYGLLPNMIYVIDKPGRIIYKSTWTEPLEVKQVLENLLLFEEAKAKGLQHRIGYAEKLYALVDDTPMHKRVLERAGRKALSDYKAVFGTDLQAT